MTKAATEHEVCAAVHEGATDRAAALLAAMPAGERRALVPEWERLRKEFRQDWGRQRRVYPALHLAGAASLTGAAAVATWLTAADFRWMAAPTGLLLGALRDREPHWLADVARRVAARPVSAGVDHALLDGLARLADCPPPVTEASVHAWIQHVNGTWEDRDGVGERIRTTRHLAAMVAGLFTTTDAGRAMANLPSAGGGDSWVTVLARLTAEGVLDRRAMVEGCVARLLRGGPAADQRVFLNLLAALELTGEERRARTADWSALAADGIPTVAAHAQAVLGELALAGDLPDRDLADLSASVFFRPEKKLVRSQLVLLGKVLSARPDAANLLLPGLAHAFGQPDADAQERALRLLERHLDKVSDEQAREELGHAADQLSPALRVRALTALGVEAQEETPEAYEETLPPVPAPARLAPAPASPAELAEEVGVLFARRDADVASFERVLDGLVRLAHRDRAALLDALAPVLARVEWHDAAPDSWRAPERYFAVDAVYRDARHLVEMLLAALTGQVSEEVLRPGTHGTVPARQCAHGPLCLALDARVREVAHRMRTGAVPPFLLSTPTWSTGSVDPWELVGRLELYSAAGIVPLRYDFAQALLRVRRADRPAAEAAAARAATLVTPEGEHLARWLTASDPLPATPERRTVDRRVRPGLGECSALVRDFPGAFARLGEPVLADVQRFWCYHFDDGARPHLLAMLPEDRELLAARLVHDAIASAVQDQRRGAAVLPLLAETGGPAGPATHLCVAYGLGSRHPEDRLAAVDALLVLAARGQLDRVRLGADLGELVSLGAVKATRLADSLRTAAATGACATVGDVLRHALPALLAEGVEPARGLGDLLGVAAECAERTGSTGALPGLDRVAGRSGSSRLVLEARRLRAALNGEAVR
ncbi:DUF6493 family protein [Streptomyces sp. NPDC002734]|uniref:DUF7824 domain-containing protein n=1 Tax=Streptomyces sp. NPDC002734 TaxID=3154426 RepID=UPI0033184F93